MFLLGPAGRAVTGEVLMVDGGFHAMGRTEGARFQAWLLGCRLDVCLSLR